MGLTGLRRWLAALVIVGGAWLVPALPVAAVTADPAVIAVHQNGAVDVPGNSTLGRIASMVLPAGNWSITATATAIGTAGVGRFECQLIAGNESYKSRTRPSGQGVASYQPIVLLLAHHFAKQGSAALECYSDGWLGSVLIRDVHLTAVKVGQLTHNGTTSGTGSPKAVYSQNPSVRGWTNNAYNDVHDVSVPAGRWLVQATLWGVSPTDGDRIDCNLASLSSVADQSFGAFQLNGGERNIALEGVFTFSSADDVSISCKDANGLWLVDGSAISAVQVGTLRYGQLGGSVTTTGSGAPTVVGGYGGPGGIADTTSLAPIGSMPLGTGAWFVTSKLSFQAGAATPNVTCQLKVAAARDQGRVILDTGNDLYNWTAMSLTKKLTAASNATVACNQSAGALGAGFFDLKIFALKAGTLTDTDLD